MSCDRDHLVGAYFDGELSREAHDQMERHLAECADCRAALERMERVSKVVRSATMRPASAMTMARLRGGLHRRHQESSVRKLAGWMTAAAAAVVVGMMTLAPSPSANSSVNAQVADVPVVNLAMIGGSEDLPEVVLAAHWMASDLSTPRSVQR